MRKVALIWGMCTASVVVIGTVAYALYLVQQYMIYVGIMYLMAIGAVPTFATVAGITWLVRYICKADYIEIGPTGTLVRYFTKVTEYHPLGLREHRVRIKEEKGKVEVPLLLDLLKGGLLGNADLLLGIRLADGTQRWGTWQELRSVGNGGKSRSGKTVTTAFYILQALLGGAVVYICDPHYRKADGLLSVLKELWPYLIIARTAEEILSVTEQFRNEMLARKEGKDCSVPHLIVYDEWSELIRELNEEQVKAVSNNVQNTNEAYAGFNGFCMVTAHEWTDQALGKKNGTAIRRGFHAKIVHRMSEEDAKFLLEGAKGKTLARKSVPALKQGTFYLQDSEGEIELLATPYYGKEREAVTYVAEMLRERNQLEAPTLYPQIEAPVYSPTSFSSEDTTMELPSIQEAPIADVRRKIKVGVDNDTRQNVYIYQDVFNLLCTLCKEGTLTGFRGVLKYCPELTETHARNTMKLIREHVGEREGLVENELV